MKIPENYKPYFFGTPNLVIEKKVKSNVSCEWDHYVKVESTKMYGYSGLLFILELLSMLLLPEIEILGLKGLTFFIYCGVLVLIFVAFVLFRLKKLKYAMNPDNFRDEFDFADLYYVRFNAYGLASDLSRLIFLYNVSADKNIEGDYTLLTYEGVTFTRDAYGQIEDVDEEDIATRKDLF